MSLNERKISSTMRFHDTTHDVKSQLTNYVQKCFPAMDFRFAFKSHSNFSRSFGFKDKVENKMKSKIVYRINCCDCDQFYIGKTIRQFVLRLVEHRKDKSSSVHKHMSDENHKIDWENFQIIDSARDDRRLLLKEMLHIKNLKPELNVQKSSELFSLLIGDRKSK
jgi:hypothetical protein